MLMWSKTLQAQKTWIPNFAAFTTDTEVGQVWIHPDLTKKTQIIIFSLNVFCDEKNMAMKPAGKLHPKQNFRPGSPALCIYVDS